MASPLMVNGVPIMVGGVPAMKPDAEDCCCPGVEQDCCPGYSVPETLTATISNVVTCASLVGVSFPITWNGSVWTGSTSVCSRTFTLTLECVSADDTFQLTGSWKTPAVCVNDFADTSVTSEQCDPLELVFDITGEVIDGTCPCCAGNALAFTVTITE